MPLAAGFEGPGSGLPCWSEGTVGAVMVIVDMFAREVLLCENKNKWRILFCAKRRVPSFAYSFLYFFELFPCTPTPAMPL